MTTGFNEVLANGSYGHVTFYNGISYQEIAGREGTDNDGASTAELVYLVRNSSDPTVCRDGFFDSPDLDLRTYDGLGRESISRVRMGNEEWEFTLSYSEKVPDVGSFTVSIDTSGGQVVQTSAYDQTAYAASGQTAVDYGNSIDVQDNKPQGVQRIIPALKISIRAKIATAYVQSPMAYSRLIANATGTTNDTAWEGFAVGELLFIGANGEVVSEEPMLTFDFLASQNATGVSIGDVTGIAKEGHQFIWFDFIDSEDSGTNRLTTKPRAAYVGQIYGAANHGLMKIGVS